MEYKPGEAWSYLPRENNALYIIKEKVELGYNCLILHTKATKLVEYFYDNYTVEYAMEKHQLVGLYSTETGEKIDPITMHNYPKLEYTTPGGIKYGVGTKFKSRNNKIVQLIELTSNEATVLYDNEEYTYPIKGSNWISFSDLLDSWEYTVVLDYQSVDPTTIKFDFTNTKIKVNSREECEWIQKAVFANGITWAINSAAKGANVFWVDTCTGLFFRDIVTRTSDSNMDYFNDQSECREITIQEILQSNKSNNMNDVIEVGDIVTHSTTGSTQYELVKCNGSNLFNSKNMVTGEYAQVNVYNLKLVSKASKQEVIGYELLKDLPGIPAGTKSKGYTLISVNKPLLNTANFHNGPIGNTFNGEQLQDTTWFKPIYKAKEVVVKISGNREVRFTDKALRIYNENNRFIGDLEKQMVVRLLADFGCTVRKTYNGNEVYASTIEVGCQTFLKDDIQKLINHLPNENFDLFPITSISS